MREKLLDLMKNEGLKPSQLAEQLENQSRRNLPHSSQDATNRASICCKRSSGGFPGSIRIGCCSIPTKCIGMNIRQPRRASRPSVQRRHKRRPPNRATTFSRRHCRADFGRMKNKRRRPTGMTDLRRSFRRRCSAKRMSNASSCSMMTRPSKVLRDRQSVKINPCGQMPGIFDSRKDKIRKKNSDKPGFRVETDGTWSIPETLGNYLLIGKEKFLATVQSPVFITRFI